MRSPRVLAAGLTIVASITLVAACSGGGTTPAAPTDDPVLVEGQKLYSQNCASCHGADGNGNVGPKWIGLADSQVTLSDGTVVTADDDYLYTSIKEPGAMKRRGAVGIMPSNKLTDQEIASIIAYIRALK